jgi:hypothetical protein
MSTTPKVVNIENEPFDIFIGRPSKWGNPFKIDEPYTRSEAIRLHAEWITTQGVLLSQLDKLRGKTLGCYCKPEACHGDILLRMANK